MPRNFVVERVVTAPAFSGGSWPRHLIGPEEGSLVGAERDALISVLRRHTASARILFDVWILATTEWEGDKVFGGSPDEARLHADALVSGGRSWLVCTDYDLNFTLVGGSETLIQGLLDHADLECVRVFTDTRVGHEADLHPGR